MRFLSLFIIIFLSSKFSFGETKTNTNAVTNSQTKPQPSNNCSPLVIKKFKEDYIKLQNSLSFEGDSIKLNAKGLGTAVDISLILMLPPSMPSMTFCAFSMSIKSSKTSLLARST